MLPWPKIRFSWALVFSFFLGIKTEIMSVAALDVYAGSVSGSGGGRLIIIGGIDGIGGNGGGVEGLSTRSTTAGSFILTIGTCFTISSPRSCKMKNLNCYSQIFKILTWGRFWLRFFILFRNLSDLRNSGGLKSMLTYYPVFVLPVPVAGSGAVW